MKNLFKKFYKHLLCICAIIAAFTVFFCMNVKTGEAVVNEEEKSVLKIWQIDSFEGGKGSRGDYLSNIGKEYLKESGYYVTVISLSADSARMNLNNGNKPDIISYGAGMYGLENYISEYKNWCHGGYCFLTLDTNSDFSDIDINNTVVNCGKDNLPEAAALLCGISGATLEKPTSAYVNLIDGKYKYLLGTQRDIFRLKTRGVAFLVKPVTEFNDLYQNISCLEGCNPKSYEFVDYLLSKSEKVCNLGMMSKELTLYEDEMKSMENIEYECKLTSPVSKSARDEIIGLIASKDIISLKSKLN